MELFVAKPRIYSLNFKRLSEEWREWLERPFSELEVKESIKGLKAYEAPKPDGFTMCFNSEFWDVVGEDVMRALSDFHATESLCRSLNSSFISLFFQKPAFLEVRDFQLISLLTNFYKLLAKVFAWRLEVVMGFIISPSQCGSSVT